MVMQMIVMLSALSIKPLYTNPDEIHVFLGESIQAAINMADPGDSIIVHEGTYSENVDVSKTVNLLGEGAVIVNAATRARTGHVMSRGATEIAGSKCEYKITLMKSYSAR